MILDVIIEPTDPIKIHNQYKKAYIDSKGGMEPIEISGTFIFQPGSFEVEQQHKSKQYFTGRITRFKMRLVHQIKKTL